MLSFWLPRVNYRGSSHISISNLYLVANCFITLLCPIKSNVISDAIAIYSSYFLGYATSIAARIIDKTTPNSNKLLWIIVLSKQASHANTTRAQHHHSKTADINTNSNKHVYIIILMAQVFFIVYFV